ncbi:MAG: hypothetical protein EXR62_02240 [Chloroflexi bacterium]|nr:hypothetical protein [Chloroflexota bacterium]
MPEPFEVSVWPSSGRGDLQTPHPELERLVCAASINARFRQLFLANPLAAADAGYQGHTFLLNHEERIFLQSLKAATNQTPTIQLLARQIAHWISPNVDQFAATSLEIAVVSTKEHSLPDALHMNVLQVENSSNEPGPLATSQEQKQPKYSQSESPSILLPAKHSRLRNHSMAFVWSQT